MVYSEAAITRDSIGVHWRRALNPAVRSPPSGHNLLATLTVLPTHRTSGSASGGRAKIVAERVVGMAIDARRLLDFYLYPFP